MWAITGGLYDIVKLLVDNGADVTVADKEQRTPLHLAANGTKKLAKLLIDHGADVNAQDKLKDTPLHHAVTFDNEKVVALLIEKGANVKSRNTDQSTPLHIAAYFGSDSSMKDLLEAKAEINAVDDIQRTPLMVAVQRFFTQKIKETVKILLKNGADPALKDNEQQTVWHVAAEKGYLSAMRLLFEYGKKFDEPAKNDETPLMLACKHGHTTTVNLLLNHGANVNNTDAKDQKTSLHFAVSAGRASDVNIVETLLEHKADANALIKNNQTVLHLAVKDGDETIVELLLKHGADPNIKDDEHKSPWDIADEKHLDKILTLFDKSGITRAVGGGVARNISSLGICYIEGHLLGSTIICSGDSSFYNYRFNIMNTTDE